MDCIRVLTHDRSVTESRIDETFTLHECNHKEIGDPDYVGFTIKGVNSLFAKAGMDLGGVYKLTDIIDSLIKSRPGSTMSETLKFIFSNYKSQGDLVVNMREEETALAA